MKILIADDHAIVREGLKQILTKHFGKGCVIEAADGYEALDVIMNNTLDVAILDLTMPGKTGLEVLKSVKPDMPDLPMLILSIHPEEQFAVRALKSGSAGYLMKDSAPGELVEAVKKVAGGGKYITPSLAEKLAFNIDMASDKKPHELLSDREFEIFKLISLGHTVTEIADSLDLSVKTVSTYRSRLMDKMKMKNNSELTRYAINNKLV